jgi:sec-independent protein translocase protein TatB
MGSVGFGEIALIAIVALLVFGPDRLPELSRKAGELLTKAREMTRSFTDSLDSEFDEATSPIRTLQSEYHATKDDLTSAAGTILNFDGPSDPGDADGETPEPESSEAEAESPPTSQAAAQSPAEDEVPDAQDRDTE